MGLSRQRENKREILHEVYFILKNHAEPRLDGWRNYPVTGDG